MIHKVTITTLVATSDRKKAVQFAVENLESPVPIGSVVSQDIDVDEFTGDLTEHVPVLDLENICKAQDRPDRSENHIG